MKVLKIFLGAVYAILIILLLLLGLKNCTNDTPQTPPPPPPAPIDTVKEPIDTTVIVEKDTIAEKEAEEIGGSGKLKVTLLWDFRGDIDLHVIEPSGNELYFENMKNPESGGYLDVDNIPGGEGACENVYWEHPPKGQYRVKLVYYNKPLFDFSSHQCKVVVFQEGCETKTYSVTMEEEDEVKQVTVINVE